MKKEKETKPIKKEAPEIIQLNPDKAAKKTNYKRKHTKEDKSKRKGRLKKNLRSDRSKY